MTKTSITNMYPTKKEILNNIQKHPIPKILVLLVKDWKKHYYTKIWNKLDTQEKQQTIEFLIKNVWTKINKPNNIHINWENNTPWSYNPITNTINGTNTSIISALHELGHAIHGDSELEACTFSIYLFKTCFPKEYGRLKWEGHMLFKH